MLARRLMHEAGLSFQLSADYRGDAFEADIDEVSGLWMDGMLFSCSKTAAIGQTGGL